MGSEAQKQIPIVDLSKEIERGSKEWSDLCKRVREACEEFGCFEVLYDKISAELREQLFSIIKDLFELPLEIKIKNNNPKPYHSYAGQNLNPPPRLYEGFGIEDASSYDSLKAFAQLLMSDPNAQLHFCKTFCNMMKGVVELHGMVMNLIKDGYGIEESNISNKSLVRVMKYKCPEPCDEDELGLLAHTDKPFCTLLCEHHVSGLQVQTNEDGQWIQWFPSPNSFIFLVGDPLMAWSNGRLHAVKHRVVMKGDKERFSFGAFQIPVEGTIIKPPVELIDEKHPRILKDFDFMEFFHFSSTREAMALDSAKQLFAFAAV